MMLLPFPAESRARWRRLDVPGWEEAIIRKAPAGWELTARLEVEDGGFAALRYVISCDGGWRTRSADITGTVDGKPVRIQLKSDAAGEWMVDDMPMPALSGALDLDLGFTPATNLLPIRRLALAIGDSAPVEGAWLRFPELRLERLVQTYTREAAQSFRYLAMVDGEPFRARLDTDEYGRVTSYEGLWVMEQVGEE